MTATCALARLTHLPSEILALVTSTLALDDLVSLWGCGSVLLNSKLSNGGVDSLCITRTRVAPRRWTSLVSCLLQLRHLRITTIFLGDFAPKTKILHLPRMLRTLELGAAIMPFVAFGTSFASDFPFMQTLIMPMGYQHLLLPRPPPNLTRLTMEGQSATNSKITRQTEALFHTLTQLRHLDFCPCISICRLVTFPVSLESLRIDVVATDLMSLLADWQSLPRTLKHLCVENVSVFKEENLAALPNELETLQLSFSMMAPRRTLSRALFDALPPTLTRLSLSSEGHITIDKDHIVIPAAVTDLNLSLSYVTPLELDGALLPRGLKLLHGHLLLRNEKMLPPGIEDLHCPDFECAESALANIPAKSLRYSISQLPSAFPALLTQLSVTTKVYIPPKMFPPTLTKLSITHHEERQSWNGEMSAQLPKALRSLTVSISTSITNDWIKHLPPALEELDATGTQWKQGLTHTFFLPSFDHHCFPLLPKTLRTLHLRGLSEAIPPEALLLLPPGLEQAALFSGTQSMTIAPTLEQWQAMPKHLQTISLPLGTSYSTNLQATKLAAQCGIASFPAGTRNGATHFQ